MLKNLYITKNIKRNKVQVNLINSGLIDLKNKIAKMSKNEIEIEQSDKIVNIVEKITDFNNQNQTRQGIKTLTPNQMLSRLSVTLAQLQAGKNSEKLKNDIRQLLYSLYCSKKITKTIYKHLINTVKKWKQSL